MATLKTVIVPAMALKEGRHKIRISVAHNGETRYIATNIIIDSDKEFKNGAVVKRPDAAILNTKLRGIIQQYQDIIDDLAYIDGITCPELVYLLKNEKAKQKRSLKSIFEEYIETANIKQSSINLYKTQWKTITSYIDENIVIDNINRITLLGLEKNLSHLISKSNYLVLMRTLLNHAKRCGYVQYRVDPMNGIKLTPIPIRQSWLSVDEIKLIRDLQTNKRNLQLCRDLFMLSYYLGGINIIDLLQINFNEQVSTIHYIRTKTNHGYKSNPFVEFDIPDEAKEIINRIKAKDGHIYATAYQNHFRYNGFFHTQMPKLAAETGIEKIIYYSARKSFSQHAFNLGINTSVIDYILGHKIDKGGSCLYSYIKVTPDMATKAIRKVLDNLK